MKKRYILNGFNSKEEALKRDQEFAVKHGIRLDSNRKYLFRTHCLVQEQWGLEVTEEYVNLLNEEEKAPERLREIPNRPFVHSYVPMLFRYLEKEFVDKFFIDGSLRLSSFQKFHQHHDEQRGDKTEGFNNIVGRGGSYTFMSSTQHGIDAFVLSTSLLDDDQMLKDFEVSSCFVIERPLQFINDIIKEIPEFKGVNYGPCLYLKEKNIHRNMPEFESDSFKDDDDKMSMRKLLNLTNQIGGGEVFFSKLSKFAHQHKYRVLFHTFLKPLPDYIDIKIPEAIKYCKRIK